MSRISLIKQSSCFNQIIHQKQTLQSLSEKIIHCFIKKTQSANGQIYLYSGESHTLKLIYSSSEQVLEKISYPDPEAIIFENNRIAFPITYDKNLLGIMTFENVERTILEEQMSEMEYLYCTLGLKFYSLISKQEYENKIRVINEHLISIELSEDGKIKGVSDAFNESLGYQQAELIGSKIDQIVLTEKLGDSPEQPKIDHAPSSEDEIQLKTKDGNSIWVSSKQIKTKNFLGEESGSIYLQQNITRQKIIEEMAIKDEVTGLYNRRFFNQLFTKQIDNAQRNGSFIAFILIDIDNFKKYNDTYGHQEGDVVLKNVADTINHCFKRKGDFVFRLGGEEFGVLCNITHIEDAETLANISRQAVQNLDIAHTGNPHKVVTISSGLFTVTPDNIGPDEDEIYKAADVALYEAKESGRNKVVIAGQEDDIELF